MVVLEKGGPPLMIFGNSHVKHLESFVKLPGHPLNISDVFRNTRFVGVVGTVRGKVVVHVTVVDLTECQSHLGNRWQT